MIGLGINAQMNDRLFLPRNISGCVLWLEADSTADFVFSSSNVIQTWVDRSGNGHSPTQATVSKQPLFATTGGANGGGSVTFDGVNDVLVKTFTWNQIEHVFMVAKLLVGGAVTDITYVDGFGANTLRVFRDRTSNTGKLKIFAGNTFTTTTDCLVWNRTEIIYNNASSSVAAQDIVTGTGTAGTNNAGGITLGCLGDGSSQPANVVFSAIIGYQGQLSTYNAALVSKYLKNKYGL